MGEEVAHLDFFSGEEGAHLDFFSGEEGAHSDFFSGKKVLFKAFQWGRRLLKTLNGGRVKFFGFSVREKGFLRPARREKCSFA